MAWNKPSTTDQQPIRKSGAKTPSAICSILAGVTIVILGALCFFLFSGNEDAPEAKATKGRGRIKEVKPAPAPKAVVQPEPDPVDTRAQKSKEWREKLMKIAEHNPQLMFHLTNDASKVEKPVFTTSVEQVMDWIFNCVPGDDPLPLPNLSEESPDIIARALISFNEVSDKDTEDIAQRKESVMLAKKALRQFIKEGGDYPEFMEYYRKQLVQYRKLWLDAQTSIEKAPADLNQEEMTRLVEKTNAMLEEKGIKPIEMNEIVRDRLGLPDPEEETQDLKKE